MVGSARSLLSVMGIVTPELRTGILLLGFGEPETSDESEVEAFLERIFLAGSSLEPEARGGAQSRARALAQARAPGLTETYRRIGGSPLMAQLRTQAEALSSVLARRGRSFPVTIAAQFTAPTIADAVEWARTEGLHRIVALPTYPVCGPSTTLAALESLGRAAGDGGEIEVREVTGWHRHPGFARLWGSAVEKYARDEGVELHDTNTLLYFSAHGTPVKYLEQVPYAAYVEEACAAVSADLGVTDYAMGYQNHGNRPIAWTQPDNQTLLPTLTCKRLIVVPISFVHEQSETLDELDVELNDLAAELGLDFHRVPVPKDDPALFELWADLAEGALEGTVSTILRRCACRGTDTSWCVKEDLER